MPLTRLLKSVQNRLDVKTFTNCRFGMMGWAVLVVTYAFKQYDSNGARAIPTFPSSDP